MNVEPARKEWKDLTAIDKAKAIGCVGLLLTVAMALGSKQPSELSPAVESATVEPAPATNDTLVAQRRILKMYYAGVLKETSICDSESNKAQKFLTPANGASTNRVSAYEAIDQARQVCRYSNYQISKLRVTKGLGDQQADFSKAQEFCAMTNYYKGTAYATALKVLDGDGRTSSIVKFKGDIENAQSSAISCIAGLYSVAGKLGMTIDELTGSGLRPKL